jgi:PAS domain S-box-containing protein
MDWSKASLALDHHAIVSITDHRGVITHVNDRFCEISGYARDELIGQRHSLLKSGRHQASLYQDLWRTISRGQVWHGVICNRRKNGGVYWVQSTIVPVDGADGQIHEYVSVRTDITDRLLAQEHSSLLSQVLNLTDQGVVILNLNGCVTYANKAVELALGYGAAHVQGRSFLELLPALDRPRCQQAWREIHTCDFQWQGQMALLRQDGAVFAAHAHVGVVADASGVPQHVFVIFSDYSQELARQAALQQAKEGAERASAAKSAFLSHTSHELRTPLNAVLGFAQLLSMGLTDQRHQAYAQEILVAGRHLVALIDEILDLATIESGRDSWQLALVDVVVLTRECVSLVQPLAAAKQISLVPSMPAHLLEVCTERLRLKQVILNLLSNAIKYSHEGACVWLDVAETTTGRLRLSVMDRGHGIKADQIEQVFEPFNRLAAPSLGIAGTGIGLSISKKLIERMGGQIGVSSQEGLGSVFWIELPLALQD